MKEKVKKICNKQYYIIIILAIFVTVPLLDEGAIIAHDSVYSIARAIGTVLSLKQGQILPLITSNFANGFGYSWNLFYPPISAYLIIIGRIFTSSYFNATKLIVVLSVILSGIFMYNLVNKVSKNKKIALLASVIYITAPYRLVDIYTRMAIGEIISFVFLPLVFQGLYSIFEDEAKENYLLIIGAAGIVLTHNISTLLTVIIAIIYVLFNIKKLKNKKIIKVLVIDIIFIIGMVAFFYLPMIEAKFACNYSVFEEGTMGSLEGMHNNALSLYQVLFGEMKNGDSAGEMCLIIGLQIIIPIIFTPYVYKKISKENKRLYLLTLITGLICLFATTNLFPWEHMPEIFAYIQFAYRFLFIAVFLLSIIAAVNIVKLCENINMKDIMIIVLAIFIYIAPIINLCVLDENFNENMFTQTDTVTEETTSTVACAYFEYLPSNVDMKYLANRSQEAIILYGNTEIIKQNKENTNMEMEINNTTEETMIELPYIYYVGYSAKLNGEKLDVVETENGFIGIIIKEGEEGIINIEYKGTLIQKITMVISIITFLIFLGYVAYIKKKVPVRKVLT